MEKIRFSLSGGLSEKQLQEIHRAVLRILDQTGIGCEHKPTVDALTSTKGIRAENGRLKFSPDTVEAVLKRVRDIGRQQQPSPRISVTGPYNCFNIIDMETDEVRASQAADVVPMLKLVAAFNNWGAPPVYPCDLDSRIQVLWLEKACIENTAGLGGFMISHDPETIRWLGRLYAAANRRYCLGLQFVLSPLKLDHIALGLIWQFKDDPLIDIHADMYPIPVGGLTAPLNAPGLLAQSIAESLGGWIVADRLGWLSSPRPLPVRVDHGDMRHMTVAYSAPENLMIQVLARDVARYFCGYELESIYLDTNAKRPDAFAAVDRTAQMLMLGLAGFRNFYMGAGQMSMDEIFSPAQFIIDMEIGRYVQHILEGLPWKSDTAEEIAQSVAQGVAEGNFLTQQSTLDMLGELFDSKLFCRDNVGQWRAAGEPTIEHRALQSARKAIDSYHFELDAGLYSAVNEVFAQACQALGANSPRVSRRSCL